MNGVRFLENLRRLFKELRNMYRAIKLDKEYLKRLDPSFEVSYQYRFHAGFRSLKLYRLSHAFYVSGFKFIAYFIYHINRVLYTVDIHPAAVLEPGVVIDHGAGVVVGSTAIVGSGTVLYHGVTLGAKYITKGKRHPTVGKNVIIGAGAKVLGPVNIGDNAKIGANSVVISDIPDNATAVGIPARIVNKNYRDDEKLSVSFSSYTDKKEKSERSDDLCPEELVNLEVAKQ
ncbi:serine O-acetyltransferase [Fervidobacterium changbaicum]|uniref:serine O-acetyltransferase n=1 Tax=Fervidobacterium changbaicum TaxID=310769 RepID=A0ABX5QU36_9BACT|nr:serine acetyltransferase [Fervidobacterium changbaicum]QAV34072.1 serine acetyltransferase [Fervidobacterium changbaicum]SDH22993.1 serine O-acetyltransferase [Fervidobacterium changbaicum]